MSGFIRPEVAAHLRRWREPLISGAVLCLGLWLALSPGPFVAGLGWAIALAGGLMLFVSFRRVRFNRAGDGPGYVKLDEGEVTYMGPYYGGSVALADLTSLALRRREDQKTFWLLAHEEGLLVVPVNAAGTDVLFDAFTTLEGLSMPAVLRALDGSHVGSITLWRRGDLPRPVQLTRPTNPPI